MVSRKTILVTGGAGYIGSHTVIRLLESGYHVKVLDNLSNSNPVVLDRIQTICGIRPDFIKGDIRDRDLLKKIFNEKRINAVIHFAGLKAVGDSEKNPLEYYENNVTGSMVLFQEMALANVKHIVFSSSATVYGDPGVVQYKEDTPVNPINVYGRTKLVVEDILRDIKKSDDCWRIAILRYFNPVGAHISGTLGEDPRGIPNNLMPYIAQVAVGEREKLSVFGGDYPTKDGTGLRDYIHVEDLVDGHIAALNALENNAETITVNLGTGQPYSVLEMITAFESASSKSIPYEIVSRRKGDLAEYYADPTYAYELMEWKANFGIDRMYVDVWRWQTNKIKGSAE
jgi:UDP-glucose 4-epimerase